MASDGSSGGRRGPPKGEGAAGRGGASARPSARRGAADKAGPGARAGGHAKPPSAKAPTAKPPSAKAPSKAPAAKAPTGRRGPAKAEGEAGRPPRERKAAKPFPKAEALNAGQIELVGVHTEELPAPWMLEVAIGGRSNVGKSSCINRLLRRDKLARTSSTPGRTQTLNFYAVGKTGVLVDLPGYGYARVPDAVKDAWAVYIESYLFNRENLALVVCLVDANIPAQQLDVQLVRSLLDADLNVLVVATKLDKVGRSKVGNTLRALASALGVAEVIGVSSASGEGMDALRSRVYAAWAGRG